MNTTKTTCAARERRSIRRTLMAARRRAADAHPLFEPLTVFVREWRALVSRRWTFWRGAYLAMMSGLVVLGMARSIWYDAGLIAVVCSGSAGWLVQTAIAADEAGRRVAHRTASTPAIGGWRLLAPIADTNPDAVLLLDLTAYLYDNVGSPVRRPVKGHPHAPRRSTYAKPIRECGREWARARALPTRRADRMVASLVDIGVIRRVPVGQATAYRLNCNSFADAGRALEARYGPLIQFDLGRDPDAFGDLAPPARSRG